MQSQPHSQLPSQSHPTMKTITTIAVVFVAAFIIGLMMRAMMLAGPQPGPSATESAESIPVDHPDHPDHADHGAHSGAAVEAVPLNNPRCPVMGGKVNPEVGVEFNGWWVNFCCPGCDDEFLANPAAFADNLKTQTGHDIRHAPDITGPNGTRPIHNPTCPIRGDNVNPEVGAEVNGWWVHFCCPACIEPFVTDPAKHAAKLKAQTGHDIQHRPTHSPR